MNLEVLQYPFDSEYILKKVKSIKRELLADTSKRIEKKIAVLGGSTTHDIINVLELFLLDNGIKPTFYESEYNQYWQDAMFGCSELTELQPDLIYIHTSNRNILNYPQMTDSKQSVDELLTRQFDHFKMMWEKLSETYQCPVIQNNFEAPYYRILGNKDVIDMHGKLNFINRLNDRFYEYANSHENFYINDINYLSACYGLDKWSDPFFWHMYKYALCVPAIPALAHNLSNIIKSIYGKNKKALVLDLDNTLWGGVVGDDGVENLEIGQETSMGQVFSEFQQYIKMQKEIGIMLNIDSKNDEKNAIEGLKHPDSLLRPDDFILIKANWDTKSKNILDIANELNVLPESMVFVDDNPAEREIVRVQVPGVAVPEMTAPENYVQVLDKSGFFEVTSLSEDDRKRNDMYKANIMRKEQSTHFDDYTDYLKSLNMVATIKAFDSIYMSRIAQLTNKSNQFNLTTKRYTQSEIESISNSNEYITLYGKLEDKFGDNGVVSVTIGKIEGKTLHIDLWLMSCRVLKRDMEYAMMDELVKKCSGKGITEIRGYYYPTAKNGMVKNFYELQDFKKESEDETGNSIWKYVITNERISKNSVIAIID